MSSLNRAQLIGRVGKDPEIRSMQSGGKVASFSVATSETWKKDGQKQERTQWHNVVVFNEHLLSVVERFVKKGDRIMVEGQIETRKWSDQSGQDRYATEIVLRPFGGNLILLGDNSAGGERQSDELPARREPGKASPIDLDDEIPF